MTKSDAVKKQKTEEIDDNYIADLFNRWTSNGKDEDFAVKKAAFDSLKKKSRLSNKGIAKFIETAMALNERAEQEEKISILMAKRANKTTTAWNIAKSLEFDRRCFQNRDGQHFVDLIKAYNGRQSDNRFKTRWEFDDGSAIVYFPGGWDLQHPKCTCGYCCAGEEELNCAHYKHRRSIKTT